MALGRKTLDYSLHVVKQVTFVSSGHLFTSTPVVKSAGVPPLHTRTPLNEKQSNRETMIECHTAKIYNYIKPSLSPSPYSKHALLPLMY